MKRTQFIVGTRVRLNTDIDLWPTGQWPQGALGTVVDDTKMTDQTVFGHIKLDTYDRNLDEWNNCLQVGDAEDSPTTLDSFDTVNEAARIVIRGYCNRLRDEYFDVYESADNAIAGLTSDAVQMDKHDAIWVLKGRTVDLGDVTYRLLTPPID